MYSHDESLNTEAQNTQRNMPKDAGINISLVRRTSVKLVLCYFTLTFLFGVPKQTNKVLTFSMIVHTFLKPKGKVMKGLHCNIIVSYVYGSWNTNDQVITLLWPRNKPILSSRVYQRVLSRLQTHMIQSFKLIVWLCGFLKPKQINKSLTSLPQRLRFRDKWVHVVSVVLHTLIGP